MKALVNKLLQRIIHKPVTRHPTQTRKSWRADANTKMRALSGPVSACMACMRSAFVFHLQEKRL
jgi:hypothetical protein